MGLILFFLGIVFSVLKLAGVIAWPWLWVLAPFWIGAAVIAVLFVGGLSLVAVFAGIAAMLHRR